MQLKWLEDFVALAQERSFTRAAELRHVTHPAFGRRIRALESWAGTPLIEREAGPVKLTAAGQAFLDTALQMTRHLAQSHDELMAIAGRQGRTVTLCTGRTLARTIVADWLVRLQPYLADGELRISTRSLADAVHDLQHGLADFSILYHHPSLVVPLDGTTPQHRPAPTACNRWKIESVSSRSCGLRARWRKAWSIDWRKCMPADSSPRGSSATACQPRPAGSKRKCRVSWSRPMAVGSRLCTVKCSRVARRSM